MIRDDFAGAGGWDVALAALGRRDVLGVETDAAACATARAAGHHRLHADVLTLATACRLDGYVFSPPCQTFSPAGTGTGREALAHLLAAVRKVADGASPADAIAAVHDETLDVRSLLVLHPLAVIRDSRPEWLAGEQVPAVLPVWNAYTEVLTAWGYSVAVGKVKAEDYGVPQTRTRAAILAHRGRDVALPAPTCQVPVTIRDVFGSAARPMFHWRGAGMAARHGVRPDRLIDRPAFTVAGDVSGSGALRWREPEGYSRLTVAEAAALQTFPADYPWSGSVGRRRGQVSNAVPPLLARALLSVLIDPKDGA